VSPDAKSNQTLCLNLSYDIFKLLITLVNFFLNKMKCDIIETGTVLLLEYTVSDYVA
jgi:hypothetical protein